MLHKNQIENADPFVQIDGPPGHFAVTNNRKTYLYYSFHPAMVAICFKLSTPLLNLRVNDSVKYFAMSDLILFIKAFLFV